MLIGYARAALADQVAVLAAQERDLKVAGVEKVVSERVSSIAKRPALAACLEFLRKGDALVVTKPDRLARSPAELLAIESDLSRRGVGLVVLSMGLDTSNGNSPTSKAMLTILAAVVTWERDVMLEGQRDSAAKIKGEGNYTGRPPTVARHAAEVRAMAAAGYRPTLIARKLGMSRASVYRLLEQTPEGPAADINWENRAADVDG
jgi:DNA invertase Pin-like site-specific DNA recombinase